MNEIYQPIAFYPFHVATPHDRAVCDVLTASGDLDELYRRHLSQFGDFLQPESAEAVDGEVYSAWIDFQNGIDIATTEFADVVLGLLDNADVPDAVCSFVKAACTPTIEINSHAVSLLYLSRKLGYIVAEEAVTKTDEPALVS